MLFSEMVRQLTSEENLKEDINQYVRSGSSWATLKNYGSINLGEAGLVIWQCKIRVASGSAYYRLKIGAHYIWGYWYNSDTWKTVEGFAWIGTGSKTVIMESYGGSSHYIDDFKLGRVKFKDSDGVAHHTYSAEITAKVDARELAVGPLKEAIYAVVAYATTPGEATNFANPGESLTNEVRIKFEGSYKSWTWRWNAGTPYENSAAYYLVASAVGTTRNVIIEKDNANTVVHVCLFGTPWILIDDPGHKPVTLDFAPGSTLYVTLEPLHDNPTKYLRIGKKRAISYGTSTDYYHSASGQNIVDDNFTFERIDPSEVEMKVYALGGCISIIAVDER